MSDFWWNRLPQNWHGYGRESVCISRCVESVDDRLNDLPHWLQANDRNDAVDGADVDADDASAADEEDIGGHEFNVSSPNGIASPPRAPSNEAVGWR